MTVEVQPPHLKKKAHGVTHPNLIAIKPTKQDPFQTPITHHEIKFALLNANSVGNKLVEISEYIKDTELNIIAFTETRLGP